MKFVSFHTEEGCFIALVLSETGETYNLQIGDVIITDVPKTVCSPWVG